MATSNTFSPSTKFSWAILITLLAGVGGGAMWTGSVNTKLEELVRVNTKLVEVVEKGGQDRSELKAKVAALEQRVIANEKRVSAIEQALRK